jgi:hypothetical protein
MANKTFLVRFNPLDLPPFTVVAETAQIQGEHLALMDSKGKLAALFLMELVASWNVLPR